MSENVILSIVGPSGAGKTTLTNYMLEKHDIAMPHHVTTRLPRKDDKKDFYRHISLNDFLEWERLKLFLISSHDTERGYGVLKSDCEQSFLKNDTILINSSYKDIYQLKKSLIEVRLVVLTFKDIEKGIWSRIYNDNRNHNIDDISYRIRSALEDHEKYFNDVSDFASAVIYTDEVNKKDTLEIAESSFGFDPLLRKRVK